MYNPMSFSNYIINVYYKRKMHVEKPWNVDLFLQLRLHMTKTDLSFDSN